MGFTHLILLIYRVLTGIIPSSSREASKNHPLDPSHHIEFLPTSYQVVLGKHPDRTFPITTESARVTRKTLKYHTLKARKQMSVHTSAYWRRSYQKNSGQDRENYQLRGTSKILHERYIFHRRFSHTVHSFFSAYRLCPLQSCGSPTLLLHDGRYCVEYGGNS